MFIIVNTVDDLIFTHAFSTKKVALQFVKKIKCHWADAKEEDWIAIEDITWYNEDTGELIHLLETKLQKTCPKRAY